MPVKQEVAGSIPATPATFKMLQLSWDWLIETLNEHKKISFHFLEYNIRRAHVHQVETLELRNYLRLLKQCGFLKLTYGWHPVHTDFETQQCFDSYHEITQKIPPISIKEAKRIKKHPWLAWFKDYEEQNINGGLAQR